jgi:carbonic anhydrase/acetyltransferase-like protein (isoleucine patch superfamily)
MNDHGVGNNVRIEHGCTIQSALIDDDCVVGYKSIVLEGAVLERGAVIAPNSVVPPGKLIPAGTYWAGSPAEFVKDLSAGEQERIAAETKTINEETLSHNRSFARSIPKLE